MISAVVLTKNEEKNLIDCLDSISWVDEIIIVDDFSLDRSLEVIDTLPYKYKIKIFKHKLNENFSSQRNFALTKATKKWVLFVDADERITSDLREEINSFLINGAKSDIEGFYLPRKDVMWGKLLTHGETGNTKLLRFAKKSAGVWQGKVHEVWNVDGKTDIFDNFILHFPHPTINEFLYEINFYTSLRAQELFEKQMKVKTLDLILYPKGKFLVNYILKLGFLDGIEGLVFAILMSFHSFLVRGKLWLIWKKN